MDPQKLIQTLVRTEPMRTYRRDEPQYRPVVTVSRDFGSGGNEIAQRLGAALQIDVYDRQILDAVAEKAKVDQGLLARLDEKGAKLKEAWFHALLSGQSVHTTHYRHHLVGVVLLLAEQGGVIVGRGAHVILGTRDAFRLRVVGSDHNCAQRIAEREGITIDAALTKVREVNAERDKALYGLFKHHLYEANLFDMVLNTDRIHDWDTAASLVLEAMRGMGFRVKGGHG